MTNRNVLAVPLYRREGATRWGRDVWIGEFALVDAEDHHRVVSLGIWRLHNMGYAVCKVRDGADRLTVLMHRYVLRLTQEQTAVHVDHYDHNPLNNTKQNLRPGTQQQNNANKPDRPRSDSSSRFKGVGRFQGGWRAQGWENGKTVWLGRHATEEDAAAAYEKWKAGRSRCA